MTCHYCQADAKKFGKFGPKKIQRYRCLMATPEQVATKLQQHANAPLP